MTARVCRFCRGSGVVEDRKTPTAAVIFGKFRGAGNSVVLSGVFFRGPGGIYTSSDGLQVGPNAAGQWESIKELTVVDSDHIYTDEEILTTYVSIN